MSNLYKFLKRKTWIPRTCKPKGIKIKDSMGRRRKVSVLEKNCRSDSNGV